jgi:hypothetical protein
MPQQPNTELTIGGRGPQAEASAPAAPGTKIDSVIALLRKPPGAALTDLTAATGWLPHTTRAALTGLKKKGHVITKVKVAGVTRYTMAVS